jgi:hypothetical protein
MESDLRARQKLVRISEAQIREDVSEPSSNSIAFRFFNSAPEGPIQTARNKI